MSIVCPARESELPLPKFETESRAVHQHDCTSLTVSDGFCCVKSIGTMSWPLSTSCNHLQQISMNNSYY